MNVLIQKSKFIKALCTNSHNFELSTLLSFIKDFTDGLPEQIYEQEFSGESPHWFIKDQLYWKEMGPPNLPTLV